jgi:hypothetical protein
MYISVVDQMNWSIEVPCQIYEPWYVAQGQEERMWESG